MLSCGPCQSSTRKASGQSAVSFCSTDTGGNPSTSGANAFTSSGKAEEQADAESLEDREFRQAVQARRKSPLDTSSSYRSTASSDDSSDPDNTAHSPGTPADKAKWDSKKKTGHQLQQHSSRLVQLQPHCFLFHCQYMHGIVLVYTAWFLTCSTPCLLHAAYVCFS